jgi:hypothetical protein
MSPLDVELWGTLLSSVLKTAGAQDVAGGHEVLKRVANEMTGKLYVFKIITELLHD